MIALLLALGCAPAVFHASDVAPDPGRDGSSDDTASDTGAEADPAAGLILADLQVADADRDWTTEPGDHLTVSVRLVDPTDADDMWYPGVRLVTEPALPGADQTMMWYGIFARTSTETSFAFDVPADFSGDSLTVRTEVITINGDAALDTLATTLAIAR